MIDSYNLKKHHFESIKCYNWSIGAILFSMWKREFFPGSTSLEVNSDSYYSTEPALGEFFHIEFPSNWTDAEKYNFDWSSLKNQPHRFEKIDYDNI